MKLRLRLTLTTAMVSIPMIVGMFWFDANQRHQAAQDALAYFTFSYMAKPETRQRCENAPATWGGMPAYDHGMDDSDHWWYNHADPSQPRGKTPVLLAYGADFHAVHPQAPELEPELWQQVAERPYVARPVRWYRSEVEILARMPWGEGPCAYIFAQGTTVPGWLGAVLPSSELWLLPMLVVLSTVLVAVGPVIRRIRQLAAAVQHAASGGYVRDVSFGGRDEIAELAHSFNRASAAIREELLAKDRREQALRNFVADTTHDVMTPLTVLQGHLATMREEVELSQKPPLETLIAAMTEAHYIGSLLQNLALAATLSTGEPQLESSCVDVNALVRRVMGRHRPIARQFHVNLEGALPEGTIVAWADVTLLEQVVNNLVYNAIRHNQPQGHVAVILEVFSPTHFRLSVVDDGPGIPADKLASLVKRGFQGERARTRASHGHGIGLEIVFRVVNMHGYRLEFSTPDVGGLRVDLVAPVFAGEQAALLSSSSLPSSPSLPSSTGFETC